MKFVNDTKVLFFSVILAIALFLIFSQINSVGFFNLSQTTDAVSTISAQDLVVQKVTALSNAFKDASSTNAKLLAAYNTKNNKNVQFSYYKDVKDMSKEIFVQEIIASWKINEYAYTAQDVEKLRASVALMDIDLVKPAALILSATNDAARLNTQAMSQVSESEKTRLTLALENDNFDSVKGILAKVNTELQVKGAAYILDATAKARPFLIEYAKKTEPQEFQDAHVSDCGTYGDVIFVQDGACVIVIGGTGQTNYQTDTGSLLKTPAVIIDLGGNDIYSGPYAVGSVGLNSGPSTFPAAVVLDISGNDYYFCTIDSSYSPGCQGGGFNGIGILEDVAGNDFYKCSRSAFYYGGCQGYGQVGIGILNDYAGTDAYDCGAAYHYACQGSALGIGYGILIDEGSEPNTFSCFTQCQGFSESWGGTGLFSISSSFNTISCNNKCQGMSSAESGVGLILDRTGRNFFTCSDYCQASTDSIGTGAIVNIQGSNIYNCYRFCQAFSDNVLGSGVIIDSNGNDDYRCNHECQARRGIIIENGGNDRYECQHDCQGITASAYSELWAYGNTLWVEADSRYTRYCVYNCGDPTGEGSNDPTNMINTSTITNVTDQIISKIPPIVGPYLCTYASGGPSGFNYMLGAFVFVNGTKYGDCVSGNASILPIIVKDVGKRVYPQTNGTVIISNCDIQITEQNLGSTNTDSYLTNCYPSITVNVPQPNIRLPFYDHFGWCRYTLCTLVGSQNAESDITSYIYASSPEGNPWYAFDGFDAYTNGSIRSGTTGHNQESRLTFSVSLPPLADRPAFYFMTFNYKVSAESKDIFYLYVTKRPKVELGPLGTLDNPTGGISCLIAPGMDNPVVERWDTFNQVPDPTNSCSHLEPGDYTFAFVYKKDAATTGGRDAVFIDNLAIKLIPVGL